MEPPSVDVLASFYAAIPAPADDAVDEPVTDAPAARSGLPVAGLPNAGNTCYAACALQLLAAAPVLTQEAARGTLNLQNPLSAGGAWAAQFQR